MAKNLKLNIKNAQLAEALKLGQIKKPSRPKPAKAKEAAPEKKEEIALPPEVAPIAQEPPVASPTPPPAPVQEIPAEPVQEKERPPTPAAATPPPQPQRFQPPPPRTPSSHTPPPRPPYQQRSSGPSSSYPPRREGGPSSFIRPSYPPGANRRPPYPPGSRPPYQPGGARPPYQQNTGRPPYPSSRPPARGVTPVIPPKEGTRFDGAVKKPMRAGEKTGFKEFKDFKPSRKTAETGKAFDSRDRQGLRADLEEQGWRKRRPAHKHKTEAQMDETPQPKELKVRLPVTIKDLAVEMKLKASQLIAKLFMKGIVLTLNDFLDDETTVQLLGHDFDCEITIDTSEADRIRITDKTIKQEIQDTPLSSLILRPPVAAFMGHVDHGKTSLIDTIRKSNIAVGEAGEITQHIGAFKCETSVGPLTILDTPGHEAFSAMRARGADVTDIVVLVIAGDEGMRTQTIEALEQARAANCPIIVALNKSDKPNFNPDLVYRQLSENNLLPEVWGGTTITVNCSATTGDGVKNLLEMLALQAEILELKANPNTRARGTVIESAMHKGMGAVATILVQNGTLRLGDPIVFAQHFAKVKTMQDEHGKDLTEAPPSTPIKITGLSGLPDAGSEFIIVANEKEAKDLAEKRSEGKRHTLLQPKRAGLESFQESPKKILTLILRADVQGSVEALKTSLIKIETKKVDLNFISSAVGEISESDVQLAAASKAIIVGFHTKVTSHAESLIKSLKVDIRLHDIIYHAVDDIKEVMLGLLDKLVQETNTGAAEVKAIFKASQLGNIAGCMVTEGTILRSDQVRVIRNGESVWKGSIASLKKVKEDVREISKGHECGILLQNYNDLKVGDILQAYQITYLQQEL